MEMTRYIPWIAEIARGVRDQKININQYEYNLAKHYFDEFQNQQLDQDIEKLNYNVNDAYEMKNKIKQMQMSSSFIDDWNSHLKEELLGDSFLCSNCLSIQIIKVRDDIIEYVDHAKVTEVESQGISKPPNLEGQKQIIQQISDNHILQSIKRDNAFAVTSITCACGDRCALLERPINNQNEN